VLQWWATRVVVILLLAGAGCGTWAADVDGDLNTVDAALMVVPEGGSPEAPQIQRRDAGTIDDEPGPLDSVRIAARCVVALRFAILMRRWHRSFVTDVPI
jgi:hypothetical protein